jgi:hypothetical protein
MWHGENLGPLGANRGKALPLPKPPPSWPPHEMKQLEKPNLLGWD